MAGLVLAGGNIFTIKQSGTSTAMNATNYYPALNLNNPYGRGPVTGDCTFTIQDLTAYHPSLSGSTVSFYYRQTSENTTDSWALAQQVPIVTSLAWDSGNTKYGYPLDLDLQQYFRVEAVSGVTTIKADIALTFQAPGGKR